MKPLVLLLASVAVAQHTQDSLPCLHYQEHGAYLLRFTRETVFIEDNPYLDETLELMSYDGKIHKKSFYPDINGRLSISTSDLPKGTYFIRISYQSGYMSGTEVYRIYITH